MDLNVLSPDGFCCSSATECKGSIRAGDRFFEGTFSHVGHHFDVSLGAKPLRVVVVGQEDGVYSPYGARKTSSVTLAERHAVIHGQSGIGSRYYSDGVHRARNPHMRGTTSALRILFGKGLGSDWDDEFLETDDGDRFHMFDAFALVNVLLCSAGPPASSTGRSSPTMQRNCLRHFKGTIAILEPTILIMQGVGVQRWIEPIVGPRKVILPSLTEAVIAGRRLLICGFSHPSARGELRWGDKINAAYLVSVVTPTLERALAEIEGPSGDAPVVRVESPDATVIRETKAPVGRSRVLGKR